MLIAACDTFRSGAVEQLKTHTCRLSSLHPSEREGGPPRVLLFERGYGKDAAGTCMEAVNFGKREREKNNYYYFAFIYSSSAEI